jgi:transcription-repair coupling factor (superfamily II helicase)
VIQLVQKNRHYKLAGQDKLAFSGHLPTLKDKVTAVKHLFAQLTQ